MRRHSSAGFTIVELMIATVVFSIVLLMIAAATIQIGRLYYKGLTAARTQEVARTVSDTITQSIQFNGGEIIPTSNVTLNNASDAQSKAFCIGSQYYMYRLGQLQLNDRHGLMTRTVGAGCNTTRADNLSTAGAKNGTDMLGERMRLSNIQVTPIDATQLRWQVLIRVVYGDDDLMCDEAIVSTSCSSETTVLTAAQLAASRNLRCKNIRSGSQFCSVSELSTIVERRITR